MSDEDAPAPQGTNRSGEGPTPGRYVDASGKNVPTTRNRAGGTPKIAPARLLAAQIGETWTPEYTTSFLTQIARGVDPGAKDGDAHVPPDWTTRRWAVSELLNRSVGKVKAHVVLEGGVDVKASVDLKVATFALDARDLDLALPEGSLDQFRAMQSALIKRAKEKVAALAGPVIDAECEER